MYHSKAACSLGIVAAALATATPVLAQVEIFRTIKSRNYTQTSNAQPTSADFYGYVHDLFDFGGTLTPENVGNATVTRPDSIVDNLVANPDGFFVTFFGPNFASEAELDAALPEGDYVFDIAGGNFGNQSGVLTQLDFNPWNAVPFATNFDELQDAQPGQDLTVEFNEWTPDAQTTPGRSAIFWSLVNLDSNTSLVFASADPQSLTSITLEGTNLTPGDYRLVLNFSARIDDVDSPGFGGGTLASLVFDSNTAIDFNVVPTPTTAGVFALSAVAALRRRRNA